VHLEITFSSELNHSFSERNSHNFYTCENSLKNVLQKLTLFSYEITKYLTPVKLQ